MATPGPARKAWPLRIELIPPLLASAVILRAAPAQYLGRQQDDLIYVLASQALSHGHYHLPISPAYVPLTMANPGWPAILLPITWLCGGNPAAYQIAAAILAAVMPWAFWIWLGRRASEPTRALLVLLFASSPAVLSESGCVMSEIPYLLALFAFLAYVEKTRGARPAVSGTLLAGLCGIRSAAFALIPAALSAAPARRRAGDALVICLVLAAGLSPWFFWSHSHGGLQKTAELAEAYRGRLPAGFLSILAANAAYYARLWARSYLPDGAASRQILPAAAGSLLGFLSLKGAVALFKEDESNRPALLALAASVALYLFWPWRYERYLMTALPFLLWTIPAGLGRWGPAALGLLLASQAAFAWLPSITRDLPLSRPELRETYGWIRENTKPWEALSSALYVRDGFYARRPPIPLPDADAGEAFAERLKQHRAGIILRQESLDLGFSSDESSPIRARLDRDFKWLQDPKLFKLLYRNAREGTAVYAPR